MRPDVGIPFGDHDRGFHQVRFPEGVPDNVRFVRGSRGLVTRCELCAPQGFAPSSVSIEI